MSKITALICVFVQISIVFWSSVTGAGWTSGWTDSTKSDCRKSSSTGQASASPIPLKPEPATTEPQSTFVAVAERVSEILHHHNVMQVEKMQNETCVENFVKYICMMNPRLCATHKVVLPSGKIYRMNVLLGVIGPKANPITAAPSSYFSGRLILKD